MTKISHDYTKGKSFLKWAFSHKRHQKVLPLTTILGLVLTIGVVVNFEKDYEKILTLIIGSLWIGLNWFRVWLIYRKLLKLEGRK